VQQHSEVGLLGRDWITKALISSMEIARTIGIQWKLGDVA
jgi:hypothetical protein